MREIERKFLIQKSPDGLVNCPSVEIRQGYLMVDETQEIRLRDKGGRYFLTVKQGIGLSRSEVEVELEERQFETLWPLTEGKRVEKTRHLVEYEGVTIELDVFQGALSGLCMAEVEFPSDEEALAFSPPDWFGEEVTDDERFKNKSLALHGRPGGGPFNQSAAIPFRFEDGEPLILLITSRRKKHWVVPKGIIEPLLSAPESAAREAWEEAGIRGRIRPQPIGEYEYDKWGGTCHVRVFLLEVEEELAEWPEAFLRERRWVSVEEAAALVDQAGLRRLILLVPDLLESGPG